MWLIFQYYETEQNTIGSLKFFMNTTDNKPKKIRLCRKFYKKGKIYDNGTYNIDAEIAESEFLYILWRYM